MKTVVSYTSYTYNHCRLNIIESAWRWIVWQSPECQVFSSFLMLTFHSPLTFALLGVIFWHFKQDSGNKDAAKVLRMLCRTFSWLLVHAAPWLSNSGHRESQFQDDQGWTFNNKLHSGFLNLFEFSLRIPSKIAGTPKHLQIINRALHVMIHSTIPS